MRLAALALMFAASPADAGWRNTEWGMTEDEFQVSAPAEVSISGKIEMRFSVEPTFEENRLVAVDLVPLEGQFCLGALDQIYLTYGSPHFQVGRTMTWQSEGNILVFSNRSTGCRIRYQDPANIQKPEVPLAPEPNTTGF